MWFLWLNFIQNSWKEVLLETRYDFIQASEWHATDESGSKKRHTFQSMFTVFINYRSVVHHGSLSEDSKHSDNRAHFPLVYRCNLEMNYYKAGCPRFGRPVSSTWTVHRLSGRLLDWKHHSRIGKLNGPWVQLWPWKKLRRKFEIFLRLSIHKKYLPATNQHEVHINTHTYRFPLSPLQPDGWLNQSITDHLKNPNWQERFFCQLHVPLESLSLTAKLSLAWDDFLKKTLTGGATIAVWLV